MGNGSLSTMQLSIVIPAYKEAQKLQQDIAAADAFLRKERISGEIVLVDDGSPDGTAAAARALQVKYPELRVVSYANNRGKGHALAQGILRAQGRYILIADAGLCVPYDIALLGIQMLSLNMCDLAHGSRRMRGSILRAQPLYRRIGSTVYGQLIHLFMGVPRYIADTQCGFKLYRREIAKELYGELITDGFMFDLEIILRALRKKFRILEFPVLWSNDADTRFNPLTGSFRLMKEMLRIRYVMFLGVRQSDARATRYTVPREEAHVT